MNNLEYQKWASNKSLLANPILWQHAKLSQNDRKARVLHGASGLAKEAGELLQIIHKVWFFGNDLDRQKMLDELGDVLWHFFEILTALDLTIETVMEQNFEKLEARTKERELYNNSGERNVT